MSKDTDIKVAAEAVFDGQRPIKVAEKRPAVGKGGAAFKSLTAAVKAAERERGEAAKYARAAEVFAELAGNCVNMSKKHLEEQRVALARHERFLKRMAWVWFVIGVVLVVLSF